ncbi:MAG: YigZ family protein [Candidatus Cloacimonetes bacterium]|nr:YigZ family protein [Candidatus Cloacimonadota bacterium]
MPDLFSITDPVVCECKVKRSLFVAHLQPTISLDEAKGFIRRINIDHKNASHNCWAYIIGYTGDTFHFSDAGEPSGTAGKPIFNTLNKYRLTNITAVVTRYFGGIKLGVRGLITAYSNIVDMAVQQSSMIEIVRMQKIRIQTDYDFIEKLQYQLEKMGASLSDFIYSGMISFLAVFPLEQGKIIMDYIDELNKRNKLHYEIES